MIIAGPEAVPLREILQALAELSNRRSSGPRLPLKAFVLLAGVTEDVCRLLKVKAPLHRRRMDFFLSDTEYDCRRARKVLAWKPEVSLRQGLGKTLKFQRESDGAVASIAAGGPVFLGKFLVAKEALDATQIMYIFV
jgi:nucleoside-diphosphate-sugar epimerase